MSHITQQDTLVFKVLDCELLLEAQSVAATSHGEAETFLLSQAELAQLSPASAKLVGMQGRMKHLDRMKRDLDLARRQPAGIMIYCKVGGANCTASRGPARGYSPPPQASRKYLKAMLHPGPDSQNRACKEKDIVMHRTNSQNDGVCLRMPQCASRIA